MKIELSNIKETYHPIMGRIVTATAHNKYMIQPVILTPNVAENPHNQHITQLEIITSDEEVTRIIALTTEVAEIKKLLGLNQSNLLHITKHKSD